MRLLMALCRTILGLTLIISGLLKLIDPVGTGLLVKEYLSFMHLGFLNGGAIAFGIALSSVEFVTGSCIIIGNRIRVFSIVSLILMGGFTLLTLYLAIFNPIADCGCFGEALHLTNWQTFFKNIVLLLCALLIFSQHRRYVLLAPVALEWCFTALLTAIALWVGISSFNHLPVKDFTALREGTDLLTLSEEQMRYETTFIYSKDGEEAEFSIEELPDSTWTFVDSRTVALEGSEKMAQIDLTLRDMEGEYDENLLVGSGRHFAAVVWDNAAMSEKKWRRIADFRQRLESAGESLILLSASENVPDEFYEECYVVDRKTLMTLLRSNGGAVYINNGVIIRKWSSKSLAGDSLDKVLNEDADNTVLSAILSANSRFNLYIIGILLILVLIWYFCRALKKKKNI